MPPPPSRVSAAATAPPPTKPDNRFDIEVSLHRVPPREAGSVGHVWGSDGALYLPPMWRLSRQSSVSLAGILLLVCISMPAGTDALDQGDRQSAPLPNDVDRESPSRLPPLRPEAPQERQQSGYDP